MRRKKKLPELYELALRAGLRQMGKDGLRRLLDYSETGKPFAMSGLIVEYNRP